MADTPQRRRRVLRQHVLTDALLGVWAVPQGDASPSVTPPSLPADESLPPAAAAAPVALDSLDAPAAPAAAIVAPAKVAVLSLEEKIKELDAIDRNQVRSCALCELCRSRTQTVFGEGDPDAAIMFIGEGPGLNEDQQGRPFVGRAGELLDKMILAMKLSRSQVYIANVVKCRPPENRTPTPQEAAACWPYLRRQIQIIQPRAIVTLGGPATKLLLNTTTGITALRGSWHQVQGLGPNGAAIPVMPTFHPAFVLRQYTPETRGKVWSDLQKVLELLAPTPAPGSASAPGIAPTPGSQ
ncbi:MAG: uracil-DNA glycosylase [Phycisphaeraceae bacterium]|nr:uracil-DNA glycosylase [Phycisphaeraceae bacterium]